MITKYLFASLGVICVILGVIGRFVPLMPTTPFLLLAAYLFSKSSPKMHKLLLENKVFGKYISNYLNNKPIPIWQKITSISLLWLGMGSSIYILDLPLWLMVLLIFIGLAVSTHIATLGKFRLRKRKTP
ncbi:MAG: YbaN family protein [Fibromonadaceae bacterium]|jgi:uncharacterized membrane protein YbaN (DUF454 family)|nr:YbaN family protein [Fibromonadaceae bacterium]